MEDISEIGLTINKIEKVVNIPPHPKVEIWALGLGDDTKIRLFLHYYVCTPLDEFYDSVKEAIKILKIKTEPKIDIKDTVTVEVNFARMYRLKKADDLFSDLFKYAPIVRVTR